jgi:hypothetical protein
MSIEPWTPFAELFVLGIGVLWVLTGSADVKQVRVGEGEMIDEGQGRYVRNGVPNMTIIPASTNGKAPFIVAGRDPLAGEMVVRVTGRQDGGYQALLKSLKSVVRLSSPTKAAAEHTMTLSGVAGAIHKVVLRTPLEHSISQLEIETLESLTSRDRTMFRLDLPLARDQEAKAEIDPQSGALSLSGTDLAGQVSGEIVRVIGGKSYSNKLQDLMRPAQDEVVRLRMLDRSVLNSPVMVERLSRTGTILEQHIYEQ